MTINNSNHNNTGTGILVQFSNIDITNYNFFIENFGHNSSSCFSINYDDLNDKYNFLVKELFIKEDKLFDLNFQEKSNLIKKDIFKKKFNSEVIVKTDLFQNNEDNIFKKTPSKYDYSKKFETNSFNGFLNLFNMTEKNNSFRTILYQMTNNNIETKIEINGNFLTCDYNFKMDTLDNVNLSLNNSNIGFGFKKIENIKFLTIWNNFNFENDKNIHVNYILEEDNNQSNHKSSFTLNNYNDLNLGYQICFDQSLNFSNHTLGLKFNKNKYFDNFEINYDNDKLQNKSIESLLSYSLLDLEINNYFYYFNDRVNSIHKVSRRL